MSHFEGSRIVYQDYGDAGEVCVPIPPLPTLAPSFVDIIMAGIPPSQIFNPTGTEYHYLHTQHPLSTLNVNYMYSEGINKQLGALMPAAGWRLHVGALEPARVEEILPPWPGGVYSITKKPEGVLLNGAASGTCGRRFIGTTDEQYYYAITGVAYYYCGIESLDPGEDVDLCRVHVRIGGGGDLTGKTLYCQIWSKSGNDLDTLLAETSVPGNAEIPLGGTSNPSLIPFFFDPVYTLLNGTTYAIVITMKEVDASNYPNVFRTALQGQPLGNTACWNSSKVRVLSNSQEPSFLLYVKK